MKAIAIGLYCVSALAPALLALGASNDQQSLRLTFRAREDSGGNFKVVERKVGWDPRKTALIICDMWDDHWCKSAARRVGEMAGPLNEVVKVARGRGEVGR